MSQCPFCKKNVSSKNNKKSNLSDKKVSTKKNIKVSIKKQKGGESAYDGGDIKLLTQASHGWYDRGVDGKNMHSIDLNAGVNEWTFSRPTPDNKFVVKSNLSFDGNKFEMVGGKKVKKLDKKMSSKKETDQEGGKKKKSVTKKPVTKKPVTKKPVTKKPVTKKPATKKPVTKKPVTKKPVTKKPVTKKPVTKKPVTKKPVSKK